MRANGFMAARAWGLRAAVHSCETNCWRKGVWAALKAEVLIERRALLEAPERSIVTVAARFEWTGGSEEVRGPGCDDSEEWRVGMRRASV